MRPRSLEEISVCVPFVTTSLRKSLSCIVQLLREKLWLSSGEPFLGDGVVQLGH
jgi:hypothetical protein